LQATTAAEAITLGAYHAESEASTRQSPVAQGRSNGTGSPSVMRNSRCTPPIPVL
jgi:hypothetical protein